MTGQAAVSAAGRIRDLVRGAGRPVFGAWLTRPSRTVLDALCASELDYVGIDCQHGTTTEGDLAGLLTTPPGHGPARVVRVSANRPELIGAAVDAGADGVVIPTVDDVAQARAAVAAVRYPPDGIRSYGPKAPFLPGAPAELAARVLVLPMIETRAGLRAAEQIAAVDGVDGLYLGPADLGLSLGLGHRQFPADEQLEPALRDVVAAACHGGVIAGIHAGSELFAQRYVDLGFRLLTLGTETSFVLAGAARILEHAGVTAAPRSPAAQASPY